jgi:hypothetical protein
MTPEARDKIIAILADAKALVEAELTRMRPSMDKAQEGGWQNNPEWERLSDVWWRIDFTGGQIDGAIATLHEVKTASVRQRTRVVAEEKPSLTNISPEVTTIHVRSRQLINRAAE